MKFVPLEETIRRLKEKKAEKAEKERLKKEKKAEKQKEKKRLRKIEESKKKRQRVNRRYYKKRRAKILAEKRKQHDKYGCFQVVIMNDYKKIEKLGLARWRNTALDIYENALAKNREEVLCPVVIKEMRKSVNHKITRSTKYEIMIVETLMDENEDKVRKLRNKEGKLVENVIKDRHYSIFKKDDWYIEETFYVYGYHPIKNRKTAHFILDMLLDGACKQNIKRVFRFRNKLVFQYDDDFDFIVCKDKNDAERLSDILEKKVKKLKMNKYIFFTDSLSKRLHQWFLTELQEKTGWSEETCKRCHA